MKKNKLEKLAEKYNCELLNVLFVYNIIHYKLDLRQIKDNSSDAYNITERYYRIRNI